MNFELLLAKEKEAYYDIVGITYSNALLLEPGSKVFRASLYTIEECKKALKEGKHVSIAKKTDYSEVLPSDLIINELSDLDRAKTAALNEISARIHQMLISISIIDLMDYLNNYVSLLNAGYFITDQNREDKYFEVIEAAQENSEPEKIKDNATFEEEQKYIEQKQKYDNAQSNLNTLEKYLNSYDKLSIIKHISEFLNETKQKIIDSMTIEDINKQMNIYKSNLENYKMVNQ